MPQRRFAALVLATVATLAACGSSGDADTSSASATVDGDVVAVDGDVVAVGDAPAPAPPSDDGAGGISGAIEVIAGAPGDAAVAACTIDRETLGTAVQAYELLNGALPTSQQDLLDAQMIREVSVRYEISADGVVVPAAGSPCT